MKPTVLTLGILLSFSLFAKAEDINLNVDVDTLTQQQYSSQSTSCVAQRVIPVGDKKVELTRPCHESPTLGLTWGTFDYPNLTVSHRNVHYWKGGYEKEVTITRPFKNELINICTGQVIESTYFSKSFVHALQYDLVNDNLDTSMTSELEGDLLPMTPEMARKHLALAQQKCLDDSIQLDDQ